MGVFMLYYLIVVFMVMLNNININGMVYKMLWMM